MNNVMKTTRDQCILALIGAILVVVCVCIGVTMNLTTLYDENFDHMGIRTFCMFTVNSNILAALTMTLVVPYAVDGLRRHNYHVPTWVSRFVLAGATCVTLTFLVSLFILAPVKGFVLIFTGSRFFLHFVCPVLTFLVFCFFMSEHPLTARDAIFATIPVLIYAVVYYIMVVVIGEAHGGWNDFYGFATRIPVWIPMLLILPLSYGIASLIRFLHNGSYQRRVKRTADFFRTNFAHADVRELVAGMARMYSDQSRKGHNILIPVRIISAMNENNEGDCTLEELCELYLKTYMENTERVKKSDLWI